MSSAREVQSRFFPCHFPHIQGLDYGGESQPAGEVGGDFFDFIPLQRRALFVSVGDVSGTGYAAAILMAGLQAFLRGLTSEHCPGPASVVQELNRIAHDVAPENFYATLFYACVDPVRRQLRYVSAGHEPALLVRKDAARVLRLECTGTVLGLSSRSTFGLRSIPLEPGDLLIAVTDGITESVGAEGRELGDSGILEIVRRDPGARASELASRIMEAANSRHCDDRTVVVVRYTGAAEQGAFEDRIADLAAVAA